MQIKVEYFNSMHACERFRVQEAQDVSAQSFALNVTIGHFAHFLERYHVIHEFVGHLVNIGFGSDRAQNGT